MASTGAGARRCLDHVFSVGASDPNLRGLLDRLLAPFGTSDEPTIHYDVVEWDAPDISGFAIYGRATVLRTMHEPDIALAHLLWEINQAAIASRAGLTLHAAAAEHDGRAVLLSAPSGAGKTTLVAALVAAGWGYLTDDIAPIEGGRVVPYPKPIGFDLHSPLLAGRRRPPAGEMRYLGAHGFLTAQDLGGQVGGASDVAAFVVPTHRPGAATTLRDLPVDEAASLAAAQSFGVKDGQRYAEIVDTLRGVRCVALEHDDLEDAVAAIAGLLDADS